MEKENGKRFFEYAYKLGDERIGVGFGWPIKGVDKILEDYVDIIKNYVHKGKVLDLGCGEGRISIFFAKNGFKAYGIDYAKEAIERAKKFAIKKKVEASTEFCVGNVLDLPYHNNYFDIAVDWSVFDHIEPENYELYLKNLLRVLKKDSFFILVVFSKNTEFIKNKKGNYYSGDAYFHFFEKREINGIFGKYFKILKIVETKSKIPPPFLFYNILVRRN